MDYEEHIAAGLAQRVEELAAFRAGIERVLATHRPHGHGQGGEAFPPTTSS